MHLQTNNKKKNQKTFKKFRLFDDEVSLVGRKGGKVEKQRKEAHQIDLEIRNYYTYR